VFFAVGKSIFCINFEFFSATCRCQKLFFLVVNPFLGRINMELLDVETQTLTTQGD